MKQFFLFFFLLSTLSALAQEKYFLVESGKNSEAAYEKAVQGDKFIDIEIEKGTLTCSFFGGKCKGFYDIVRTSSGFVKGFNYTLALGYLQRDVAINNTFEDLTYKLARGTKFYFYPDMLSAPKWHFLEISSEEFPEKLVFVRKH